MTPADGLTDRARAVYVAATELFAGRQQDESGNRRVFDWEIGNATGYALPDVQDDLVSLTADWLSTKGNRESGIYVVAVDDPPGTAG